MMQRQSAKRLVDITSFEKIGKYPQDFRIFLIMSLNF
jgi:hypothetical protein